MNILMLNYEFPPLGGGAGRAMWNILRHWKGRKNLELHLVTSALGEGRREEMAPNIKLHHLDIGKNDGMHHQSVRDLLLYSWKAWRHSQDMIKNINFDLCHAFFGIPCGLIAQQLGLPYIVSLRGSDVPFYSNRFRVLDRLLFRHLSQRIWRGARKVVANSEGLRQLAWRTMPGMDIEVIPNGVDTDRFYPDYSRHDNLRVLSVARLIPRKRLSCLVQSIGELRDWDIRLTIVGEGPERSRLQGLIHDMNLGDRVHLKGYVPHEQLPQIYRSHDVFVLPSDNEGMSNTALEALASGLPLVMTRTGGAVELLVDKGNGVVLASGTSSHITAALRRYMNDSGLPERHGKRSRDMAEGMSWGAVAEQYEQLYHSISGS